MPKIALIVGTRLQIVRTARLIKLIKSKFDLLHTGRHYDYLRAFLNRRFEALCLVKVLVICHAKSNALAFPEIPFELNVDSDVA